MRVNASAKSLTATAIITATASLLSGCGSYWDLREGEQLAVGCAERLNYYIDEDGDGWGRPDSAPTPACGPDAEAKLTASNAKDCDELDRLVTGKTGAICPADIAGGSEQVAGQIVGQSEFVATYGTSPVLHYAQAVSDCTMWAGGPTPETPEGAHYGLARLETANEYNAVIDWLSTLGDAPMSVWVDLVWSGDLESGQWQWSDGTDPTYVPPCGGVEPSPADLYPNLVLGLPEADATLESHLPTMRLALVRDGEDWCRGVPDVFDADGAGPYAPREAHLVCERYTPAFSAHEERAE